MAVTRQRPAARSSRVCRTKPGALDGRLKPGGRPGVVGVQLVPAGERQRPGGDHGAARVQPGAVGEEHLLRAGRVEPAPQQRVRKSRHAPTLRREAAGRPAVRPGGRTRRGPAVGVGPGSGGAVAPLA